nr:hypothetical protein [Microbacterium ginsengisoli]
MELELDHRLDLRAEIGRDESGEFGVVVLGADLGLVDEDRLQLAAVLLAEAPVADEVGVERALAVAGHLHDQTGATDPAAQCRLQVVVVGAATLADPPRGQDLLHELERLVVDDRRMASWIGGPLEGDDAGVVRLRQELLQPVLV